MERRNTRREICEYFKVTRQTIYDWQKQGMPFERIGRKMLRYNIQEVRQWLNARS